MIKVVHIAGPANFGGIGRIVLDLCNVQMKNNELKPEVIITRTSGDMIQSFDELNIKYHIVNLRSGYDFNPVKLWKLFNLLRQNDIIHIHGFNLFIALLSKVSGKIIIYTEHGNFGFGRRKKNTDKINKILLSKFLNYYVDFITFNSIFTKDLAIKRYKLKNTNYAVIYNGIDYQGNYSDIQNKDEKNKYRDKFIIGTTSRFVGVKRIDRLIISFYHLTRIIENVILLLVGDGILMDQLKQLTDKYDLKDKVIFTGYRKDVRNYQEMMDICVFPSENESFGLVAIECLALGKPVIVFRDGGGIAEIVKDIEPLDIVDDVDGLVQRMIFYYNNRQAINGKIDQRKKYAKKFDIRVMEKDLFQIYKEKISCAG